MKGEREAVAHPAEFGKGHGCNLGCGGGRVNEVTGYNEIERLKQNVLERVEYVVLRHPQHSNAQGGSQKTISHG